MATHRRILILVLGAASLFTTPILAQQNNSPSSTTSQSSTATIATIQNPAEEKNVNAGIQISGAVALQGSTLSLGNGSTVTAGKQTLAIHLTRGGNLNLCATTQLRLSQSKSSSDMPGALMMSLDRGALEAQYTLGKDSDVILTPDLRILISGPGQADVRLRVNSQGDTCVDNHVDHPNELTPYITVSEEMGDGVYRVQPNQRVMFERGSLRAVVDSEPEPCGCPTVPVLSVASSGTTTGQGLIAQPGQAVAESPDTAFPIAESEGLAPPPAAPMQPAVAPGQTHVEVATTLMYDANHPDAKQNSAAEASTFGTSSAHTSAPASASNSVPNSNLAPYVAFADAPPPRQRTGILHHIGHFFRRMFRHGE